MRALLSPTNSPTTSPTTSPTRQINTVEYKALGFVPGRVVQEGEITPVSNDTFEVRPRSTAQRRQLAAVGGWPRPRQWQPCGGSLSSAASNPPHPAVPRPHPPAHPPQLKFANDGVRGGPVSRQLQVVYLDDRVR